nr:type VI secretion system-associated FHA domain protein TagH [Pseudomonas agronomica]
MDARQFVSPNPCRKIFGMAGGVIGRGEACDWVIPDSERLLSKRHAQVSFRGGVFFLTDISGNGISHRRSGARLPKGEPVPIKDGDIYVMGECELLARLVARSGNSIPEADRSVSTGNFIPDDAFVGLDPLEALDRPERAYSEIDELINPSAIPAYGSGRLDPARADRESLRLPELVDADNELAPLPAPEPSKPVREDFWQRFGHSLGMDLGDMDEEAREALAVNVAQLLRQSVRGLQQSLRTRSELKSELRLAQTFFQGPRKNPLKYTDDALPMLLQPGAPLQLSASEAIARSFHDLQAHQVALLAASRSTLHAVLEHFSPRQLVLRMGREQKPLISTSGGHWRAFGRYHQGLCEDDDWIERLLARDFAKAYEEQVRLVSTLQNDLHG